MTAWSLRGRRMGWLLLAQASTLLGMRASSVGCWWRLARLSPHDARVLGALAFLRAQSGRKLGALAWQRRLVALMPERADALYNLGFLLEAQQCHGDALQAFQAAVARSPGLDRAWYGMGRCLWRLGRPDEALVALKHNTELQPWSPDAYVEMAHIHAALGQTDRLHELVRHLQGFEPRVAARLSATYLGTHAPEEGA